MLANHFLKTKKEFRNLKKTGDTNYIYKNELDSACFQHGMAYGEFKDLARRTASDKIFRDKAFNIAKNLKYHGYQRGLPSVVYKFTDKKSAGSGVNMFANNERPWDLAEELHKLIIRKL